MMPSETPMEHEHDFGDARCACGTTATRLLAVYRETLAEQVTYTQQLQAELDGRGLDDSKVRP